MAAGVAVAAGPGYIQERRFLYPPAEQAEEEALTSQGRTVMEPEALAASDLSTTTASLERTARTEARTEAVPTAGVLPHSEVLDHIWSLPVREQYESVGGPTRSTRLSWTLAKDQTLERFQILRIL